MTINLTVLTPEAVIQASDRCISVDGNPVSEFNKAVVFRSDRLSLSITYTGLAADDSGVPTERWITEQIVEEQFVNCDVVELASAIGAAADSLFGRLPAAWRLPTIITVAGWDHSVGDELVVAQVENCLDDDGSLINVKTAFAVRSLDATRRIHSSGSLRQEHPADDRLIDRMIRSRRKEPQIIAALVWVVRMTAAEHLVVGEDPVVVILPKSGNARSEYHPAHSELLTFGPSLVTCTSDVRMIIGSPEVVYGSQKIEATAGNMVLGDTSKGLGVEVSSKRRNV